MNPYGALVLATIYTLIYAALHTWMGRKLTRGSITGSRVKDLFLTEGEKFEGRFCIFIIGPIFIWGIILAIIYQSERGQKIMEAIIEHVTMVYLTAITHIMSK